MKNRSQTHTRSTQVVTFSQFQIHGPHTDIPECRSWPACRTLEGANGTLSSFRGRPPTAKHAQKPSPEAHLKPRFKPGCTRIHLRARTQHPQNAHEHTKTHYGQHTDLHGPFWHFPTNTQGHKWGGSSGQGGFDGPVVGRRRLAEWSKALAQGASPQGRGFEPHSCHFIAVASC